MEEKTEFDDIFRLYYTRLFIYAFQMIGTKEECRDIVNSAYEHVWMNFQLMDRSTVRSFLYSFVRSRCLDYLRHLDVHNQYVEYCKSCDEGYEPEPALMDMDYRIVIIRELMSNLKPSTRQILEACYIDKKKYREVAEEMNMSTSVVKKNLTKALNLLREKIAKKQ